MEMKIDSENEELVITVRGTISGGIDVTQGDDLICITPDKIVDFVMAAHSIAVKIAAGDEEEWEGEEEEEEGAVDICVDPEGCFVRLDQGQNQIVILTREHAKSIAEGLLMLVEEA